ncbi:Septum site-determining protein MinD [bacterium HR30]|nr:Septum site-determining protein MinD [bacterium HR30]
MPTSERSTAARNSLTSLLRTKQLILCVGCGGVGKTTTAAALAVSAALLGRKTAVLTVDPAQRLKTALGLDRLSHTPHRIQLNGAARSFDALALDTKHMFDELVQRFAPNQEVAERIFANRLYRELSSELAGSAEYMAMEKLHDLVDSGTYEVLIVDTPPSAHVRDLLAAPSRLLTLLASRAVGLLQAPARLVENAPTRTTRFVFRALLEALQRWSGLPLLRDLADFVSGFESMLQRFADRAERTSKMLREEYTAFLLVTTPEPRTLAIAQEFAAELKGGRYPIAGVVANRVHCFGGQQRTKPNIDDPFVRRLWENYLALTERSQRDAQALAELVRSSGLPLLATIPVQSNPPVSVSALCEMARYLLA